MRCVAGAIILLSVLFSPTGQVTPEPKCKLQKLAVDAALGNPFAQHNLGIAFCKGDLITQNFSKAARMWRLASDVGVIAAYDNLGFLTYNGKGVKLDYAEGVRLWRIAAEKGFVESQVHLGYAYTDRKYLQPDHLEAYAWAKCAMPYASQEEDADMLRRAGNLIKLSREELSEVQRLEAEKKASEYISKYKPL